jgi:hypothetical protein
VPATRYPRARTIADASAAAPLIPLPFRTRTPVFERGSIRAAWAGAAGFGLALCFAGAEACLVSRAACAAAAWTCGASERPSSTSPRITSAISSIAATPEATSVALRQGRTSSICGAGESTGA